MSRLEHVNIKVLDPDKTAAALCALFNWRVRWAEVGLRTGRTVLVGGDDQYVALFGFGDATAAGTESYRILGDLNHIGVVVSVGSGREVDQTAGLSHRKPC